MLIISGEKIDVCDHEKPETMQRSFNRQYSLPDDIRVNSIRANLIDGVLEIIVIYNKKKSSEFYKPTFINLRAVEQHGRKLKLMEIIVHLKTKII